MCIPGAAGFRLDMRETGALRRIGDADEMLAGRALNLPAGVAQVALQRLITVGTVEFEFVRVHRLHPQYAQTRRKKYMKDLFMLLVDRMRM
jgi:hypothetical protein